MGVCDGMCRHSSPMRRGRKMAGDGDAVLNVCGGKGVNSGGRGIRRRGSIRSRGHVAKPPTAKSEIEKPSSADSGEEGWIYVRSCRIERAGLRIDSHGEVYVPDSEDDEAGNEVKASGIDVAGNLTPKVSGADGVKLATQVATDEAAGMELHLEVAARLEKVLAGMDPLYHDTFITMYKVMVPLFFKP